MAVQQDASCVGTPHIHRDLAVLVHAAQHKSPSLSFKRTEKEEGGKGKECGKMLARFAHFYRLDRSNISARRSVVRGVVTFDISCDTGHRTQQVITVRGCEYIN